MKKNVVYILIAVTMLILASCQSSGSEMDLNWNGEYLYKALNDEKLEKIKEDPPVEFLFHVDQGGYGRTATFKEGTSLDKAVELFCNIRIGKETGEWVTDNYNWIEFKWEDGSHTSISINNRNLEYYVHSTPHVFQLKHLDEFWSYASGYLKEDG